MDTTQATIAALLAHGMVEAADRVAAEALEAYRRRVAREEACLCGPPTPEEQDELNFGL